MEDFVLVPEAAALEKDAEPLLPVSEAKTPEAEALSQEDNVVPMAEHTILKEKAGLRVEDPLPEASAVPKYFL